MSILGARGDGFSPGGRGPSDAIAFPTLYQVFGNAAGTVVQKMWSSIPTWAASQAGSGLSAEALETVFNVQADLIISKNGP
jgi:choline dehydrogenase